MTHAPFKGVPQSDYRLLHPEKVRGKFILSIRTDNPEAEVGLFMDGKELAYEKWQAHRQLTQTVHKKIKEILDKSSIQIKDLSGIVVFEGPGSFTGLRIGISVSNALAYGLSIPITSARGQNWIKSASKKLAVGQDQKIVQPHYGRPANITKPRK